jgi:hypothetical protein
MRTSPAIPSVSPSPLSSTESHPSPPSYAVFSFHDVHPTPEFKLNPPQPSLSLRSPDSPVVPTSIYPLPPEYPPASSGVDDGEPKWLSQAITMPIGDILAISPSMRAKFAEYIRHLDSISASKPICDLPPMPVLSSPVPTFASVLGKLFTNSLTSSSLVLILITWALSTHFSSSPKHLRYYGYITDMISFLLSYVTRSLMDYILF